MFKDLMFFAIIMYVRKIFFKEANMNIGEIKFVIDEISKIIDFEFKNIEVEKGDNLTIIADKDKIKIMCSEKTHLARALSVVKREFLKGNKEFTHTESANFKQRGIMLDMSRNGVMRVEAVKKYIAYMASFGLNTLWLYTEDTYHLEKYPFFGYMRGRYTKEEIKEIDDYAFNLGVEVLPCIQTLGHMEQYLRHQEALSVKDTASVMLCNSEETYALIEEMIKFWRDCLRTNKIHIGMDEANDVGLGAYLAKNGYTQRGKIIEEHLKRVYEICLKNDIKPLMWSDMYVRMGSKIDYHYDTNSRLTKEQAEKIPDVDMVNWDYYHTDVDYYVKMIDVHRVMNKHISFASGIWTWDGLLPNVSYTFKTMIPALKASIKENIDTFIGTMWGDGGCETNHFYALFGLAIISEYTFCKEDVLEDKIYEMLEAVTGFERCAVEDIDSYNGYFTDVVKVMETQILAMRKGTQLVWNDILYDLIDFDTKDMVFECDKLKKIAEKNDKWRTYYLFAQTLIEIAKIKQGISLNLRKEYKNKNKEYLKNILENVLPYLKQKYTLAHSLHKKMWRETYKVFGWEVIDMRYATSLSRIDYAMEEFKKYINSETYKIEELEEEKLYQKNPTGRYFRALVPTSNLI